MAPLRRKFRFDEKPPKTHFQRTQHSVEPPQQIWKDQFLHCVIHSGTTGETFQFGESASLNFSRKWLPQDSARFSQFLLVGSWFAKQRRRAKWDCKRKRDVPLWLLCLWRYPRIVGNHYSAFNLSKGVQHTTFRRIYRKEKNESSTDNGRLGLVFVWLGLSIICTYSLQVCMYLLRVRLLRAK